LGLAVFLIRSVTANSAPAVRKRKVAMDIGVRPSLRRVLTTTKELPQKRMSRSMRNALNLLIDVVFICGVSCSMVGC